MSSVQNIKEKYLGVAKNSILYLTKDNINIMVRLQDNDDNLYKFFNVNESGRKIFEMIDGKLTVNDFIIAFCEKYEIDFDENKGWIEKFIIEMMQKDAMVVTDAPEEHKIIHQGDKNRISPMHAAIEITEKCNLRCKHCYLEADICKTSIIDYERFTQLVDKLVENNVVNVEITGGEIFMHPQVFDILKLCYKKFATVGVLTNGTVMTDEVLNLIEAHKDRTIVNISIDSVDSATHDDFRGMKGAWDASCNTVKRLSERGIKVRVASSISDDNMWDIDKLADLSVSLGASIFCFNFIEEFGRGAQLNSGNDYVKMDKYSDYLGKVIKQYKDIIPIVKEEDRSEIIMSENCGSGTRSIVIGANGFVRPCQLSPKVGFMGNILEEGFTDIFNKPEIRRLAEIAPPDIRNGCDPECKHINRCHGCYIKGIEKNKHMDSPCSWVTKNHLEDVLAMFKG